MQRCRVVVEQQRKMVNLIEVARPILYRLMKIVGVRPVDVEIEPVGTTLHFWVPSETAAVVVVNKKPNPQDERSKPKPHSKKPAVVLVHGFAGEGIFTWPFQVLTLSRRYAVYVPDHLFFGGSTTLSSDRTPSFQAECLARALHKLGLHRYTLVGLSYGGLVAFHLAEMYPHRVEAVVASGAIIDMCESETKVEMAKLGFQSLTEMLMPDDVEGLKTVFNIATYNKFLIPNRVYADFLKAMFSNRDERHEMLEAMMRELNFPNINPSIPSFKQRVHLIWGEKDRMLRTGLALRLKQQLGEKATFETIKNAGHLVPLERPFAYNRRLKRFLGSLYSTSSDNHQHANNTK